MQPMQLVIMLFIVDEELVGRRFMAAWATGSMSRRDGRVGFPSTQWKLDVSIIVLDRSIDALCWRDCKA